MAKDEAQLDLLGGLSAGPSPAAAHRGAEVRWAKRELAGRLGWSSIDASPQDRVASQASVVLVVGDAAPFGDADEHDLRHLALPLDF